MHTPIHPDFDSYLAQKSTQLQSLYYAVRSLVISLYPDANEILYHTQALTSVYSTSLKLKDAYCHIPIYTEHLNLGFNYGAMLNDPAGLLQGNGAKIRHIPIRDESELENPAIVALIEEAITLSLLQLAQVPTEVGQVVSKIKKAGD